MIIKFKRDTAFRKQFFVPDSFAHPAKMDAQLLIWIVERYTKVGETILDLMAGSGTLMLACTLGRSVVLVELEEKFCKMMRDNWEIVKMHPQLGYSMGECQIIQEDARQLEGLLVDKIVTSPPYADTGHSQGDSEMQKDIIEKKHTWAGQEYSQDPSNIGNLPYGNIDSIITSPPYEGSVSGNELDQSEKLIERQSGKHKWGKHLRLGESTLHTYSQNASNIGNLKSQSYLEAMEIVYRNCFSVLKPQGLMILVTKNFIRKKQVIRLDKDTIKLCEQAGFTFLERHYRKLPAQSFWRVIYHKKFPDVEQIEFEDVLVFRRGL